MRAQLIRTAEMFPTTDDMLPKPEVRISRAAEFVIDRIPEPDFLPRFLDEAQSRTQTKFYSSQNAYVSRVLNCRVVWNYADDEAIEIYSVIADRPLE